MLVGGGIVYLYADGTFALAEYRFVLSAVVWTELAVITLVAINMSATAISREREDGTLDLLLTTPITASAYLAGKLRGLIAYLFPLLCVPMATLAFAALYGLFGPASATTVTDGNGMTGPVVLPEGALVAPFIIVPFTAFCVMIGLNWSLKSRGTLGSVVATVGVVGVATGIVGLCAWNMMSGVPVIGPGLAALSPASAVAAIVQPEQSFQDSIQQSGMVTARSAFGIGAVFAAVVYAAVCYGIHSAMVRGFDMTVRRLAGNK